jgi:RNA polymerase sigma factor (sigma-70 family)
MSESNSRTTNPSLLLRIRDLGDSRSWHEFAEVYGPVIRGYCLRRGLQEADAADVTQEVLAQVARAIGSFEYRPGRGTFRAWLGTMTRNKITRFFEMNGRHVQSAGGSRSAEPAATVSEDPEWSSEFHSRILEAALARIRGDFESRTWSAFVQVWSRDQPAPLVAKTFEMTIDAVYAAKSRILRRLRDEVLALADDLPIGMPLS